MMFNKEYMYESGSKEGYYGSLILETSDPAHFRALESFILFSY